ncbi:MAG TPA: sensor histidine kinase [Usitatibacter sp.]|nr:sensor histidine kinase [Usitatibacter sp.]
MTEAATPPPVPACEAVDQFHPLEVFPVFKRIRPSPVRNLAYTFIWSTALGMIIFAVGAVFAPQLPTREDFVWTFIFANAIGFTIHGLYWIGDRSRLERWVRARGHYVKTLYYAGVSTVGVMLGYSFVAMTLDSRLIRQWLKNPQWLAAFAFTSFVISLVLSVIFFWRERHARAEAALQSERLRTERVEREATLANLRALQAQIEPHFLFNTLANVASLVDPDPAKAKRMLDSFIRFLRASLAATRTESTTLDAEGELIAAYLDVLQVRMGGRLAYRVDIAPDLGAFELPPMLLQPVVENAIRHGLEPKVDGGVVELSARAAAPGRVQIAISDTGMGFAPTTRGGLGLTNLRDRLRLVYAGRASLSVAEAPGGGTRVVIELPA